MTVSLAESYEHCRKIARVRARNFYYSFLLLEKEQRDSMCALYTFNRVCDDISDEPEKHGYDSPRAAIGSWREQLKAALAGDFSGHPCWPAFHDSVRRYGIPEEYFFDMIQGVASDLERDHMETFEDLHRYCLQVASTVGLTIIHVFGFEDPRAIPLAETCGIAFQLTNILRDVREDAEMGRVYLPRKDLDRFGVSHDMLQDGRVSKEFRELMRFEAGRASEYYTESAPLIGMVSPKSRGSLWTLIRIYHRLLERMEQANFDVLTRRIRVPTWEKCWTVFQGMTGAHK